MASINLDPQPSGSNQDSEERNQVVLPGQGPQRASIARDRFQKSTQGKYSERGLIFDGSTRLGEAIVIIMRA